YFRVVRPASQRLAHIELVEERRVDQYQIPRERLEECVLLEDERAACLQGHEPGQGAFEVQLSVHALLPIERQLARGRFADVDARVASVQVDAAEAVRLELRGPIAQVRRQCRIA